MTAGDQHPGPGPSWSARFLAPLALAAVTIGVIAVIGGSGDGGGSAAGGSATTETTTTTAAEAPPKKYTVQPLDSLSGIAAEFGLSVDDLITLNPDVDPQALAPGTKLKLR